MVVLKRETQSKLRNFSEKIIDLKENKIFQINKKIKLEKERLADIIEKSKRINEEQRKINISVLELNKKIFEIGNFLKTLENQLPKEDEEHIIKQIAEKENFLTRKLDGGFEKEKEIARSIIRDEKTKLEAIKLVKKMREDIIQLQALSAERNKELEEKNEEYKIHDFNIKQSKIILDNLYLEKNKIIKEYDENIQNHDNTFFILEKINSRLDEISRQRNKIHENYGLYINNNELSKIKEDTKKKMKSGTKLSLDELKLIYDEK